MDGMADKQSHKDTIVIWHEAVQLFDRGERRTALANLQTIQEPSAKILYNIGHIQQVSDNNRNAVQVSECTGNNNNAKQLL